MKRRVMQTSITLLKISVLVVLFYFFLLPWFQEEIKPPVRITFKDDPVVASKQARLTALRPGKPKLEINKLEVANKQTDTTRTNTTIVSRLATTRKAKKCKPKENIVYLKTHTSASTAVQNILLRYGLRHKLQFALPNNSHDFSYPHSFSKNSIANQGTESFNIICHSMRFNPKVLQEIMPKDSVYVTMVHESAALFRFTFDHLWSAVSAFQQIPKNSIEKWLDNADEYMEAAPYSKYNFFAKNQMMYDLGFNNTQVHDRYIRDAIVEIEERFDLVLLPNYLDESLVLLADLLCCDLKELAYISADRGSKATNYWDSLNEKLRLWNKADTLLFEHFNATLWTKIERYGFENMAADVKRLKKIRADLFDTCVESKKTDDISTANETWNGEVYKPVDGGVVKYELKQSAANIEDCKLLILPEKEFNEQVFEMQQMKFILKKN